MIVGEKVTVTKSSDPSVTGRKGEVVLETAKTLRLNSGDKTITIAKAGSVLFLDGSGRVLDGNELAGRLEDRLRVWKR
jgi:RNase P/RNase MRP subunit p29